MNDMVDCELVLQLCLEGCNCFGSRHSYSATQGLLLLIICIVLVPTYHIFSYIHKYSLVLNQMSDLFLESILYLASTTAVPECLQQHAH